MVHGIGKDNIILSGWDFIFSAETSMAWTNNSMFDFLSDLMDSPAGKETSTLIPELDCLVIMDWKTDWIDFSFFGHNKTHWIGDNFWLF